MVEQMPVRPSRHLGALAALICIVVLGCSDPGAPDTPPDPANRSLHGTISQVDLPNGLAAHLVIESLAGSSSLAADGSFEVRADTTAGAQPLIAITAEGTPVYVSLARAGRDPVSLGAESTVASLLVFDPLLLGVPDSCRERLVRTGLAASGEAVELLRRRVAEGRMRSLVDREDLQLQRLLAGVLRQVGGVEEGACLTGKGMLDAASRPHVESGPIGTRMPIAVNPEPSNFSIAIEDYFDRTPRLAAALGPASLLDLRHVGQPVPVSIALPSGRYRVRFANGAQGARDAGSSEGQRAMTADLAIVAGGIIDAFGIPPRQAWRSDARLLQPTELDRFEAYSSAITEGDPAALMRSAYALLEHNMDVLLASEAQDFMEILCEVGATQAEGSAEAPVGPILCALTQPPVIEVGDIRVIGSIVSPIDPPETIRRPEGLDAAYYRGRVVVTWQDAANNEEGYLVERATQGVSEEIARLGEGASTYTDRAVLAGGVYRYRVQAYHRLGRSDWSEPRQIEMPAEIDTVAPAAIADLKAQSAGTSSVLLSWTAPGDDGAEGFAAGYEVRYSITPITASSWWTATPVSGTPSPAAAGTTEYMFVPDLSPDRTYSFAVAAVDEVNNRSPLSNIATGTVGGEERWSTEFDAAPNGQGLDGSVETLVMYDGDLIAGGTFLSGGGTQLNYIGRWNGTNWMPLGSGMERWVSALTVFNGELIAGGHFVSASGVPAGYIARWDGSSWHPIGKGFSGIVYALAVHDGELYAGGAFQMSGDTELHGIARWDGENWNALAGGVNNQVFIIFEYQGDLIVGGDFTEAGGVAGTGQIARWDGTRWSPLGAGMDLDYVHGLVERDGDLYAGGQFIHASGLLANSVARWDGERWHALGTGMDRWVYRMTTFDGKILAAGSFLTAGGTRSPFLALWDGNRWAPFPGGSPNGEVHVVLNSPSGLIVGGWFTKLGSTPSTYIGRWGR
jgi:hypothetical protein